MVSDRPRALACKGFTFESGDPLMLKESLAGMAFGFNKVSIVATTACVCGNFLLIDKGMG